MTSRIKKLDWDLCEIYFIELPYSSEVGLGADVNLRFSHINDLTEKDKDLIRIKICAGIDEAITIINAGRNIDERTYGKN